MHIYSKINSRDMLYLLKEITASAHQVVAQDHGVGALPRPQLLVVLGEVRVCCDGQLHAALDKLRLIELSAAGTANAASKQAASSKQVSKPQAASSKQQGVRQKASRSRQQAASSEQ